MRKSRDNINALLRKAPKSDLGTNSSGSSSRLPSLGDFRLAGMARATANSGIHFGKPPSARSGAKSGSSELTTLLQHGLQKTTSSLVSSFLNPFGLGIFGSFFSGLGHLFGGAQQTLPPLTPFSLPDSVQQNLNAGSQQAGSATLSPSHNGLPDAATQQWISDHKGDIADAVKSALLQSHSLSDVIGEL
jgi:hypothetical protein